MSDPGTERLREAFAANVDVAGDGADCPRPDRLWASARKELPATDNAAVVLHLGECGNCAAAWRVARTINEGRGLAAAKPPDARGLRGWFPLTAAAAVVLVSVGLTLVFVDREDTPVRPVFREQSGTWLSPRTGDNPLPRNACVLRWAEGAEGTTYDVRVTRADLDVLDRVFGLEEAAYEVPPTALEGISAGSSIFWQVTAHTPDGRAIVSETFSSTLE